MHRFYLTQPLTEKLLVSEENIVHQISRVFRAKKGNEFCFFGPDTADHIYGYDDDKRGILYFTLKEKRDIPKKNKVQLTVFLSYPHKIDTLELIVQKLVEIGATNLVLFHGERSQVSEISTNKKLRLEKISKEALEQCGANKPLEIMYSDKDLSHLLSEHPGIAHIVGNPRGEKNLDNFSTDLPVGLWIGPEGGWSPEEEEHFREKRVYSWCFNDRILRLETACIVGAGILSYLGAR